MHGLSAGDWVQIGGDSALVVVTAIYVFFTWRLAALSRQANSVSVRLLTTSHRVHLDNRLPLYILHCEDFEWSPPEPGEVQDGDYSMVWRLDLLSDQPARLSTGPTGAVACEFLFDGHVMRGPIDIAASLSASHTLSCRIRTDAAHTAAGAELFIQIDDIIESVVDTIALSATWQTPDAAQLGPTHTVNRSYPGMADVSIGHLI